MCGNGVVANGNGYRILLKDTRINRFVLAENINYRNYEGAKWARISQGKSDAE